MNQQHMICIGAQRTSTTRLFACLKMHPEIILPRDKEVHYFNAVSPPYEDLEPKTPDFLTRLSIRIALGATDFFARNAPARRHFRRKLLRGRHIPEYYFGLFKSDGGINCDITPAYALLSEEAIKCMRDTVPDAKILFIIRDPVERMWSELLYFYHMRHGEDGYSRLLDDYRDIDDFGEHQRKRCDYAATSKMFQSYFSDVMIVVFEEMNMRPRQTIADICEFVGISRDDHILDSMPFDIRFNQSPRHQIPKHLEGRFLKFLADNYESCIDEFGDKIRAWKYVDNFR